MRLVEAIPTAGALRFEMLTQGKRQPGHVGKLPRRVGFRGLRRRPPMMRRQRICHRRGKLD